jgi:hypothetical protein
VNKTVFTANILALLALPAAAPYAADMATHANSVASAKPSDAKPLENLELAAQRLRDAIHAMADAPAGPRRNQAINDADRALIEVNNAMGSLPPGMLLSEEKEGDYKKAIDRLQQSSDRLRDAAHALAKDPASAKRNETIREINKALAETQQVMVDMPLSAWRK